MDLSKKHRIILIIVTALVAFSLIATSVLPFIIQ